MNEYQITKCFKTKVLTQLIEDIFRKVAAKNNDKKT